jgi:hypothetical protein
MYRSPKEQVAYHEPSAGKRTFCRADNGRISKRALQTGPVVREKQRWANMFVARKKHSRPIRSRDDSERMAKTQEAGATRRLPAVLKSSSD